MIGSRAGAAVATGPHTSAAVETDTAGASGCTTLLIADDDAVTRSGLRTLLSMQPGIVVVGEAVDGIEAVELAGQLRPDVVLMDVRMPRRNGIEATRQLLAGPADPPKVVVITTFENDDYVTAALSAGASGFVLKRLPVPKIAEAVRVVAAGEAILFPAALRLMATGRSNPDIAESCRVSLETVKTHVGNVLTKLGAQNRTHAVVIAYETGLVVPGVTG
ncbi:response regulator transcription factor [Streptomyces vinaceus]|uniref:response regulator transcription factor n=1 Tax=Streptomyces vinaceus TaxID=1960 RepID=UPI0036C3EE74